MKLLFRKYALYMIIFLIGLLLLGNIYLIDRNNSIITENKQLEDNTAVIKTKTDDIIRTLHFMDMTMRGYALQTMPNYEKDLILARKRMEHDFIMLENGLTRQHYPMAVFNVMRDTIKNYFATLDIMKDLLDKGERPAFLKILREDRGYRAWKAYDHFARNVTAFENNIALQAEDRYNETLRNSYWLQVVLFFIIIPTLAYTAVFTRRTLKLTEQLRRAEADKNLLLENQNQELEMRVQYRTFEIQAKNEEIISHNRQLTLQQDKIAHQHAMAMRQNSELQSAKKIIEEQSEFIRHKNDELQIEVQRQTQHLQETNLELIEHNNRLEQFAFIISHNLRAPITRLVGLSNVLNLTDDTDEQKNILGMIVKSTYELDEVIADLNQILRIQKLSTGVYERIALDNLIVKMRKMLDDELKETHSQIFTDFADVVDITSLPQYVESIFYNLISNAIKYRHPERSPVIRINARRSGSKLRIDVCDNGIGIDVERNRANLFNLYKRFHFHVEGKGLGLYLVKTQVTALGGTIEVASHPEEGTIFTILLDN